MRLGEILKSVKTNTRVECPYCQSKIIPVKGIKPNLRHQCGKVIDTKIVYRCPECKEEL